MTKRLLIPVLLTICFLSEAFAQMPKTVKVETPVSSLVGANSMVCPAGVSAFAGTTTQALDPTAQSNDVEFLCFNDILNVTHQGGQTFGDPDPISPPGIAYHFYTCTPTVSGPDFATMITDPCISLDFTTANNDPYLITAPLVQINGDAVLQNMGALQSLLNGGAPIELFFAPTTIDDFAAATYEDDNIGGPAGPCINVNVGDAYRIVFLNEVAGTNINTATTGPCSGSFVAEGGLPEFDNSIYTNIEITLASDPTIVGTTPTPLNISHGETVTFSVPQPGIYNVIIEDGRSCSATFQIDMSNCTVFNSTIGDEVTASGSNVCVPVSSSAGFTDLFSFQYIIEYDPAVLAFSSVNPVNIPPTLSSSTPSAGQIIVSWFSDDILFGSTLVGDNVLYEVCFTAIGPNGTSSDVSFVGTPPPGTPIEVSDINGPLGYTLTDGSVTIGSSAFILNFGVCTSEAGNTDGSFTVSPTGGTAPYSLSWEQQGNPGNTGTANIPDGIVGGLAPGTYDVTVTDAANETVIGSVVIPDLQPLSVQTSFVNPTCVNTSDGSVSVNIVGGVAPYDVIWNVPAPAPLPAGNYSVSVTDALGCVLSSAQSLIAPMLELTVNNQQDITCTGITTGSISVTASGTNGPFTYQWTNGETTPDVSNLPPGPITVAVTDANNCVIVQNFTITEPALPIIQSFDSVSVSCPNQMTGSLTVNAVPGMGGAAISSYLWNDPNNQNTQTADMLIAGDYIVTVTDDVGCSVVETASLYAPSPLAVDLIITEPSCPTFNNGSIQLILSGATLPYEIEWFDGNTFPVAASLACGEDNRYSVSITDVNGCDTIVIDTFIPCPPSIDIVFDVANVEAVSCFEGVPCDGSYTALASGGTGTTNMYSFSWSSGEIYNNVSQSTAVALCQGEQYVIVSDGFCPSDTAFFEIGAPTKLEFDIAGILTTEPSCFGDSDGSAMVGAIGGTPDYTYAWGNPVTTGPSISGVPTGNYIVTVTDFKGCTNSITINIDQPDPLVAVLDTFVDPTCSGGENGEISVSQTGGTVGITTYNWAPNTGTNTQLASGLSAGTYAVTITDVNGCSDNLTYSLSEPAPISAVILDPPEPFCFGAPTVVSLDGNPTGGIGTSYTFSVDFGPPQFPNASIPILAGEHTIQVFDSLGCSVEYTIDVGQPDEVRVLLSDNDDDMNNIIELELGSSVELRPNYSLSGVPIDTILWDPLDHLDCDSLAGVTDTFCFSPWVSPLETTTYEVTVIDTNGCVGTAEIIVEIDRNRNVFIPNAFSPNGDGVNDFLRVYTGVGVETVNYFRIFDRWGEQVYEANEFTYSQNSQDGWDGRMNGKTMNSGIYPYIAEIVFVDGRVLLYRGDIALVR